MNKQTLSFLSIFKWIGLAIMLAIICSFFPPRQKHPNILFISVDDLRPELGCYGKSHMKTPNIDTLATNGVLFKRAYCQQAICSPSRTSLLTGLRPDVTGVYDLEKHFRIQKSDIITLPQLFKQNGYDAISLGKIFHLNDAMSWSQKEWSPKMITKRGYVTNENIKITEDYKTYGPISEKADIADSIYPDAQTTLKAIQYLKQNINKPFFLAVGYIRPHLPFAAPKKYWDLYNYNQIKLSNLNRKPKDAPALAFNNAGEMRLYTDIPRSGPLDDETEKRAIHGYYACVSFIDAQIGLLLNALKEAGFADNTIIVLWGDHGYKLGEYNDWVKHTNFEIDVNAPLIISFPGIKGKGKTANDLTEFIDIYPTLCDLAGLPRPNHLQGKSLIPVLQNPKKIIHQAAYNQYPRENIYAMGYSVRTNEYRMTVWYKLKDSKPDSLIAFELYDHRINNDEMVNFAEMDKGKKIVSKLFPLLQKGFPILNNQSWKLTRGNALLH